jgi:hypothetical protein
MKLAKKKKPHQVDDMSQKLSEQNPCGQTHA